MTVDEIYQRKIKLLEEALDKLEGIVRNLRTERDALEEENIDLLTKMAKEDLKS